MIRLCKPPIHKGGWLCTYCSHIEKLRIWGACIECLKEKLPLHIVKDKYLLFWGCNPQYYLENIHLRYLKEYTQPYMAPIKQVANWQRNKGNMHAYVFPIAHRKIETLRLAALEALTPELENQFLALRIK